MALTELQQQQLQIHTENLSQSRPSIFFPVEQAKNRGDRRRVVVWGMRETEAVDTGLPVIERLQRKGIGVYIMVDGLAREMLRRNLDRLNLQSGGLVLHTTDQVGFFDTRLYVAGQSASADIQPSGPDFEQLFAAKGRKQEIPSVWYGVPLSLDSEKRRLALEGRLIIPDHVFVLGESLEQPLGVNESIPELTDRIVRVEDTDRFIGKVLELVS